MRVVFIGVDQEMANMATLSLHLRWPNATVLIAADATEGLELVERESPDAVLLQPNFSDMPLSEAIQGLRRFSDVPLLVIGRECGEMEAVTCLELGADSYLGRPSNLGELMARIYAVLRRAGNGKNHNGGGPIASGGLVINPATYEVFLDDRRITLTSTEFRLLHLLIRNRGTTTAHQVMERAIWGDEVDSSALVKKYIQRLRRKLEDDSQTPRWIANVHGVGYRFIGPAPGSSRYAPEVA